MQTTDLNFERQEVIDWLIVCGYPPLPVAPSQDPRKHYKVVQQDPEKGVWQHCPLERGTLHPLPLYIGKNPSYLDRDGIPHLINHRQYQNRLPYDHELEVWFAHPDNGVGTLGGWNNTVWLDFDLKQFEAEGDCTQAAFKVLDKVKEVAGETFLERSHSGGWRIGVRVKEKPDFTNFALEPGGKHVGEAIGEGRFTVLAPTIGPSGNPYRSINRTLPVEVESLESIGIYSTKGEKKCEVERIKDEKTLHSSSLTPEHSVGSIPLEMLGNNTSREILRGSSPTEDRSRALATAAQEWYGWQNWAQDNGIAVSHTPEELVHLAGQQLGIDSDRIDRILNTIDPARCQPATLYRGGEASCWTKIRQLDRALFEEKCPAEIYGKIESGNSKKPSKSSNNSTGRGGAMSNGNGNNSSSNGGGGGAGSNVKLDPFDSNPQQNKWTAPVSWNGEIGWLVPVEKPVTETDPETGKERPVRDRKGKPVTKIELVFFPKCNFDFQIEQELSSIDQEDGGGLVLQVKRSISSRTKVIDTV